MNSPAGMRTKAMPRLLTKVVPPRLETPDGTLLVGAAWDDAGSAGALATTAAGAAWMALCATLGTWSSPNRVVINGVAAVSPPITRDASAMVTRPSTNHTH